MPNLRQELDSLTHEFALRIAQSVRHATIADLAESTTPAKPARPPRGEPRKRATASPKGASADGPKRSSRKG